MVNANQTPQYADIKQAGHEGGEFLFIPLDRGRVPVPVPVGKVTATAPAEAPNMELAFWQAIQGSAKAGDFEAYLQQFPEGTFAPLAKSRLASLRQQRDGAAAPDDLTGIWVSEPLTNPFDKSDRFQLHFDFRVMGGKLIGSITRKSTPDSPRQYGTRRGIVDGKLESGTLTFNEPFQVLFGSETQDHKRSFTGQMTGDGISFFQQDTMGNPPVEFMATRSKNP